jgi:hypothetical protein
MKLLKGLEIVKETEDRLMTLGGPQHQVQDTLGLHKVMVSLPDPG